MPAIDNDAQASPLIPWMDELLGQLGRLQQRQLVVLQGSRDWCDAQLAALLSRPQPPLLFSDRDFTPGAIPFAKADDSLGGEACLVAVDLFCGFNPDVLCICAGLVRGGGVLLLLSPSLAEWNLENDRYASWQDCAFSSEPRFAQYFYAALAADEKVGKVITAERLPSPQVALPALTRTPIEGGETVQQGECLRRIEDWLDASREGVALIRAQRGRGKSSCLGLLVRRLQPQRRILVSARSKRVAASLLKMAGNVEFVAPDQLLQTLPAADLVIVDEAAMIPQSLLRQLLRHYDHLAMATTDRGYEGTGQGFMLRFVADLDRQKLLQVELDDPVRWCRGDYLESWLDRVMLQDPSGIDPALKHTDASRCELQVIEEASADIVVLRQVYRLLNQAHYRSRPSDLRMLMENPDLVLIVARAQEHVVAAVVLNREGGFDSEMCQQVFLGQRRPRGHLLAQMLTAQAGVRNFAAYRGLRVQRIAVDEAWRRQRLGTRLLQRAREFACANAMDYLGASFALDASTAAFWQQADFALVHVSYAQGKSSGNHSIAVVDPLNSTVERDVARLQQRVIRQLPVWMTQFLQFMESEQVVALLGFSRFEADLSELEADEIEAFAQGHKGFELCFAALQRFVMQRVALPGYDVDSLLVEKAIQNRPWQGLHEDLGDSGRKALQQRLRGLVEALRKAC